MKTHNCIFLSVIFALTSCVSLNLPDFNRVQHGMSKAEVHRLFGSPTYSSFDEHGSSWEYVYGETARTRDCAVIDFVNDRVVSFRSFAQPLPWQYYSRTEYPRTEHLLPKSPNPCSPYLRMFLTADRQRYQNLLESLQKESFASERFRILKGAVKEMRFSASQVADILKLETFDSDRVVALRVLAPAICDRSELHRIFGAFTFLSSREEAEEILQ